MDGAFAGSEPRRPAVVVKPNVRGKVLAKFEFAGANQLGIFSFTEVHLACEESLAAKRDVAASPDKDSQLILAPGRAVRLEVDAGNDKKRVRAAMERKIQANGWNIASSDSVVIKAEIVHGKTRQEAVPAHAQRSSGR
jgi:hypothetical protein